MGVIFGPYLTAVEPLALVKPDDRTFTRGLTIVPYTLPAATGVVPPYTYKVSDLPARLLLAPSFDTQEPPTITIALELDASAPDSTQVTYSVTDSTNASPVAHTFTIHAKTLTLSRIG